MNDSCIKPNFIIAGAAKSGTSSLARYLTSSPEIFIPKRKELHYFSKDGYLGQLNGPGDKVNLEFCCQSWEEYLSEYDGSSEFPLRGDASPSYIRYPETAKKIRDALGENIKIIFLLRDPVYRAYSNYLHMVRDGRESLSFNDALHAEKDRKKNGWTEFWQYSSGGLYFDSLNEYVEVFGKKNVKVVTFEDFIGRTDQVVKEIASFIGADPKKVNIDRTIVNKSGVIRFGYLGKFFYRDSLVKDIIKKIIPKKTRERVRNYIDRYFLSNSTGPDQESIKLIRKKTEQDVLKTEKLFDMKTSWH